MQIRLYKILLLFTLVIINIGNASSQNTLHQGDKAPDISIPDVNGNIISLSSFKGKVVLVDFWASWCGPCRMANEETIEVYNEYHELGFEIFSISLDRKKDHWQRAIRDDHLPWKNHVCDFKEWDSDACKKYNVVALPGTYLVDEYGHILTSDVDYYDLKKILKKYFSKTLAFPTVTCDSIFFTNKIKYEISDEHNNILIKGNSNSINVSNLNSGIYKLKFDGKIHKIDILNNTKPNYTIDNKILNLEKETNIQIYNNRGFLLYESKTEKKVDLTKFNETKLFLIVDGYSKFIQF